MRPLLIAALLALPGLSLADDGPRLLPAASWKKIRRAAPAGDEPRITETAWFRKEHRKAKMNNPADCAACHPKMKSS